MQPSIITEQASHAAAVPPLPNVVSEALVLSNRAFHRAVPKLDWPATLDDQTIRMLTAAAAAVENAIEALKQADVTRDPWMD